MRLISSRLAAAAAALAAAVPAALAPAAPASPRAASPSAPAAAAAAAPSSTCFGAAARDPLRPCRDPALRLAVLPTPEDALLEPNGRCTPTGRTAILLPCAFGVPKEQAQEVVALVGDSHASHWRAAVEVAAQAQRWRGISITRSGCPFSRAVARLADPGEQRGCRDWNRATLRWLAQHPEVHTVLVSQHSGGKVVLRGGASTEATQIAGYAAAWKALPASVTRIIVIRDTPRNTTRTAACVERALAARRPAGPACAVPRSAALRPDPAMAAAAAAGARVRTVDLTSFMCSPRLCQPVIGGALVHKDVDHLTRTFAATLGPYLLRQLRR